MLSELKTAVGSISKIGFYEFKRITDTLLPKYKEKTMAKRKFELGILAIVFVFGMTFIGCVSSPGFNYDITALSEVSVVDITVETRWNRGTRGMPGLGGPGILGFDTTVRNLTGDVISIVWARSTISYDGRSHMPFIEGQRFIDATTPQDPMIIPPNGSTRVFMSSAGQANFVQGHGWRIFPVYTNTMTIVLCIERNNENYFYTIVVNARETP